MVLFFRTSLLFTIRSFSSYFPYLAQGKGNGRKKINTQTRFTEIPETSFVILRESIFRSEEEGERREHKRERGEATQRTRGR